MIQPLLVAAFLLAAPAAAPTPAPAAKAAAKGASPAAPEGPVVIETKRGKLEFSHQAHAKAACAKCHPGAKPPGKIGVKGKDAAHRFCMGCHRSEKQGPQQCTACHERTR